MNETIRVDVDALARAGDARLTGEIRRTPQDFQVEEVFTHALDGAGEHLWLSVEKTGLTTPQAASRLASACNLAPRLVGYAGMKDRHAVTRQWFSLPWPIKADLPSWPSTPELQVLDAKRHGRKLKRGAHAGNRFVIRLSGLAGRADFEPAVAAARIEREGVPNYFGAQRFGHNGANVELARALFAGRRLHRNQRSIALSAARSFLFNTVLDARVAAGNWCQVLPGEVLMLDGSQSVFCADDAGESLSQLAERIAVQDLHPTGPMPGETGARSRLASAEAGALEADCLARYPDLVDGLVGARVAADRRALRLRLAEVSLVPDGDDLVARFMLPAGAFATAVLRELGHFRDVKRAAPASA